MSYVNIGAVKRSIFMSVTTAVLAMLTVSSAYAATEGELLTQFGSHGSGAGQLNIVRAMASDASTGHVYMADLGNHRVDEFTALGKFVKAFGWDVAPGAVSEEQEVRVRAATGQFRLSFGASSTGDLAYGAPASATEGAGSVEAALDALPSIFSSGGSVSVSGVKGNTLGTPYVYVVTFNGSLAGANVAQFVAGNGSTPLGGGTPSTSLEVRTRADGTSGGSGLESCTAASACKTGTEGPSSGQIGSPSGIAVDASGDIYVREPSNNRVQKFDSAGRFLLMFGGEVDKTTGEDVCTIASGDECGVGVSGTGHGQLSGGSSIAIDPTGTVFVADTNRIEEFEPDGAYKTEISLSGQSNPMLALDATSGDFYILNFNKASMSGATGVGKFSADGVGLGGIEVATPTALATDSDGNLYVVDAYDHVTEEPGRVLEFNPSGVLISAIIPPTRTEFSEVASIGTNTAGDLYAARLNNGSYDEILAYGPAPVSFESPAEVPPSIISQYAVSVDTTDATLQAQINPQFWQDARYYVEYGTGKCSEGGCDQTQPALPGVALTTKSTGAPFTSSGVLLYGLQPGTTYHYRFVVRSSGGGPVRGVGGEVGADGEEGAFRTFALSGGSETGCPNQAFRTGPSAQLPDCRAYEMVSPIDKNNGDILTPLDVSGYPTGLYQSSLSGEGFTYSSYRAFGDAMSAPIPNQYVASRGSAGWSSQAIAPPREVTQAGEDPLFEPEYQGFSTDLSEGWLLFGNEPPLVPGVAKGSSDLYRRDNQTAGYEALIPEGISSAIDRTVLQGHSADGSEAIFQTGAKLTTDAVASVDQLYYASAGLLRLVCVLPNGSPNDGNCSAGSPPTGVASSRTRTASLTYAISADGSRVYWSASPNATSPGKLYLRLNPGQAQSSLDSEDHCEDPSAACTLAVTSKAAQFWAANADGSKALYAITEGAKTGDLEEFDLEEDASSLIAHKVVGVLGQSEDLSYVYFVSSEALGVANTEGKTPNVGKPNLYLYHEGVDTFIATLSGQDVRLQSGLSDAESQPFLHVAAASPESQYLTFLLNESLTGYDSVDVVTVQPDSVISSTSVNTFVF
jgi:sugar lactone lactonase YvrE